VKSKAVVIVSEELKHQVIEHIRLHYGDVVMDLEHRQKIQRELSAMYTAMWHGEYLETAGTDDAIEDEDDDELKPFFAVLRALDLELMEHHANNLVNLIIPMDLKGTVMMIITELDENETHDHDQ
jgi:hypothetical protein